MTEDVYVRAVPGEASKGHVISQNVRKYTKIEFTAPEGGTVTDLGQGAFSYFPDSGTSSDTFKYRIRNNKKISNWSKVHVKVVSTPEKIVLDYGYGGSTTREVLSRMEDVVKAYPDLVVLLIGTNDVFSGEIGITEYKNNLLKIISYITSTSAGVVLVTLPPVIEPYVLDRMVYQKYPSPSDKIHAYNQVIKQVAHKHNIELVDLHKIVMQQPGGATKSASSCIRNQANSSARDGVHLRTECYELLAQEIYETINEPDDPAYANIIALGDSLTVGIHEPKGYPDYLANLLGHGVEKRYYPKVKAAIEFCRKHPNKDGCRRLLEKVKDKQQKAGQTGGA